ncbi:MAG: nuclear transport factor 2 family protein [Gemmataceae bacterium]|nr:nuclear transport factor 2 family protein [Gemmataceae bacterium]
MALVLVHGNTGQFHSFNNEAEQTIQMEINGRLKRLNNAYLTHNRAIVRDSMTSDHVTITPIVYLGSAAEVLESMENYQIREYQTEDEEFRILSPVTVLVNYKAHIHGHFGSKDISGDFRVSALWCRQNGFWKEACYQETKIGN